jgi:hypothetical protein
MVEFDFGKKLVFFFLGKRARKSANASFGGGDMKSILECGHDCTRPFRNVPSSEYTWLQDHVFVLSNGDCWDRQVEKERNGFEPTRQHKKAKGSMSCFTTAPCSMQHFYMSIRCGMRYQVCNAVILT